MSDTYSSQPPKPQGQGKLSDFGKPADPIGQAKEIGRELSSKASSMTHDAVQAAKDQASELGAKAKSLIGDATHKVGDVMAEQKSAGADYVVSIAQCVERAAGEFDHSVPQAARYIRQAAGQIQGIADAVRQRDMRELVDEVQDFARRQPALFFGGAMLLGFAAVRFLKSAGPLPSSHQSDSSDAEGFASHDRAYH